MLSFSVATVDTPGRLWPKFCLSFWTKTYICPTFDFFFTFIQALTSGYSPATPLAYLILHLTSFYFLFQCNNFYWIIKTGQNSACHFEPKLTFLRRSSRNLSSLFYDQIFSDFKWIIKASYMRQKILNLSEYKRYDV